LPCLENEDAWKTAPATNPLKELYWKQYGGAGPNNSPPPQVGNDLEPAAKPQAKSAKKTRKQSAKE
jgi:hypothetical protein